MLNFFVAWSERARALRNFNRVHKCTRAAIPYIIYLPDVCVLRVLLYMAAFGSSSSISSSFLLPRWYVFKIFLLVTVLNCLVSESIAKNSTKEFIATQLRSINLLLIGPDPNGFCLSTWFSRVVVYPKEFSDSRYLPVRWCRAQSVSIYMPF